LIPFGKDSSIIIHNCGKIVAEASLPELFDSSSVVLKLVFSGNDSIDRCCDKIIGFEDTVDTASQSFKTLLLISFIPLIKSTAGNS